MNANASFKASTLHDVAREAGVSLTTASRALGNPKLVSDATILKVQAAAEVLHLQSSGGWAEVNAQPDGGLFGAHHLGRAISPVQTLTESLSAAGYQLILGQTGYGHRHEEALINTMISRRPDGIVLTGLVHSARSRERLRRVGILGVETWDLSDRPVDMLVFFSHTKVGAAIAGYFLGNGWQRVGIATGDDHRAAFRWQGFLAAIGRDVPTAVVPAPSSLALGRRALGELLLQSPCCKRCTAVPTSWRRASGRRQWRAVSGCRRIWPCAVLATPTSPPTCFPR